MDWIPTGSTRLIRAKERGNRGIFPSNKVPSGITEYESCLERDLLLISNHAPDIKVIQHQPITITYIDKNKKTRHYTPDVYIEFENNLKILFEIKYESDLKNNKEKYEERWLAAQKWGKAHNIIFAVITETKIRTPRYYNIWFTLGASKCPIEKNYITKLVELIPPNGERYDQICYSLSEICGIEINKSAQILCYSIYHGLVFVDSFSTRQIKNDTIIYKKKKDGLPFRRMDEEWDLDKNNHPLNSISEIKIKDEQLEDKTPQISLEYNEIVEKRLELIKLWLKQPMNKRSSEWRSQFCLDNQISERIIYYWITSYKKNGIDGLIPQYQKAGRQPKYDSKCIELMEKARQFFLKPLTTIQHAYNELNKLCTNENISPPTESSFKRYIYTNTTALDFAKKRGPSYLKSNFTPSLASFQGAIMPLQIIQMDNTSFDVFPVDSEYREKLSTPNLTVAIDCYTRMITGFNLSYFPCSSNSVLDVMIQSILPKESYVSDFETQSNWPIQGFPVVLLVDNGLDFQSKRVQDFCIKNDVIIEYAPIKTPRFKAYIEQWFKILHNGLVNEKVSGVRPLLRQRIENSELKPESEAILTLQELEDWLHKWILDEYHFTNPYDDHSPAPYLKWREYEDGRTNIILPLPREPPKNKPELNRLFISTFERDEKTLSKDGINWNYLKYHNRNLNDIYAKIGNKKVDILINPRDIRNIWVIDPSSLNTIKVELASGWAQTLIKIHGDKPINASAWKKEIKQLKMILKSKISHYSYQQEVSRIKREDLLKNAEKATKTVRKEKEKNKEITRKQQKEIIKPDLDPSTEIFSTSDVFSYNNQSVTPILDKASEIDLKVFEIPRPSNIVIPPRNKNPFSGITKQKAKEMMKKKNE